MAGKRINIVTDQTRRLLHWVLLTGLVVAAVVSIRQLAPRSVADAFAEAPTLPETFQTFASILLGIVLGAVPFLALGAVVSGLLEVFVSPSLLGRFMPRGAVGAVLVGACLGVVVPVCEAGAVLVARRLARKGLPLPVCVAFLLAAPAVNPIVIASTASAFGFGPMVVGRLVLSIAVAATVGLLFSRPPPEQVLVPRATPAPVAADRSDDGSTRVGTRALSALRVAGEDLFDLSRYLVMGSLLAALLGTLVPQSLLLALGQGGVSSLLVMLGLAYLQSVSATGDAFLALGLVGTFPPASVLGFLVLGPMVDVKNTLLFASMFRRRAVAYLVLGPLVLTATTAIIINNFIW